MKILVIEDYLPLRESVVQSLRESGYSVDETGDGEEGLWYAQTGTYDVVILDWMLPKMDGLSLLERLRGEGNPVHVLIITAKDSLQERLTGLDVGADDFLVKPFAHEELLARVRALTRRKYEMKCPLIQVSDLQIDTNERVAVRRGKVIDLSDREYAILECLARRVGRVVSRTEIWDHVYDFNSDPNSNVVDAFIRLLRRKLEAGGLPRLIHTKRGRGYLLQDNDPCVPSEPL